MKIREVLEAFDWGQKEKGQVPFKTTSITDAHIQKIIARVSQETGVPPADIAKSIEEHQEVKMMQELRKYSPALFDTIAQNAVESAAFKNIQDSIKLQKMKFDDVKFDFKTFLTLCQLITYEHTPSDGSLGFFPLQAPGDPLRIYNIKPILTPTTNKDLEKYNSITTAAATPNGEFIFNKNFMQNLINYAAVTGVKPKGAKYQSNGGTIPDSYCYIEFLILHELFHFVFGDFQSGRRFAQYTPISHNWASDFRSNYLLVKSGYEQLPMGLFSDDLNFDRTHTSSYEKLIKVVNDEMRKLPPHLRQWVDDELDSMDEHTDPGYQPKVGDIVQNHSTGDIGRVTRVYPNGDIDVEPVEQSKENT